MARKIRPYKRKKGSPKQKRELSTVNKFLDQLMTVYYQPMNNEKKMQNK